MHGTNVATLPNGILQPEFSLKVWHPPVALLPRTFVGLCDIGAMCNVLNVLDLHVRPYWLGKQIQWYNPPNLHYISSLHCSGLLFVQNTMLVLWRVNCNLVQQLECEVSRPSASRAQGLEVRIGSQKVKYNLDAVPLETEMGIGREPSSPENQKHQNRSKPPQEVSRVIRPLPTFYNSHTCRSVDVVNSLFFMFSKGRNVLELWTRVQVNSLHINVPPHHITITPLHHTMRNRKPL